MPTRHIRTLLVTLTLPSAALAQSPLVFTAPIAAPFLVVAPGRLVLESAFRRSEARGTVREDFGHSVLRVGVTPRLELRFGVRPAARLSRPGAAAVDGFAGSDLGVRLQLIAGPRPVLHWVPRTSLTLGWWIPDGTVGALSAPQAMRDGRLYSNWRLTSRTVAVGQLGVGESMVGTGVRRFVSSGGAILHQASTHLRFVGEYTWRESASGPRPQQVRAGAIIAIGPVEFDARYAHGVSGIPGDHGISLLVAARGWTW